MVSDEDWLAAVGAEIAENAWVEKTLGPDLYVVTTDPIWAFELTQRASDIADRLDGIKYVRFRARRENEAKVAQEEPTRREQYAEYLRSNHWRSLRQWALERADYRCQVCNAAELTLHVHHRNYANLGGELPGDLVVLCESCHSTFHRNGKLA